MAQKQREETAKRAQQLALDAALLAAENKAAAAKSPAVSRREIQCFVDGECLDSQILDFRKTNNSQECLKACQATQGCEWFTFYEDTMTCTSLSGCIGLSTEKCGDCTSGEEECPEFICGVQGKCFGALEGIRKVEDIMECKTICRNRPECKWYTYEAAEKACTITNDCPVLDKTCKHCMSYENACPDPAKGMYS